MGLQKNWRGLQLINFVLSFIPDQWSWSVCYWRSSSGPAWIVYSSIFHYVWLKHDTVPDGGGMPLKYQQWGQDVGLNQPIFPSQTRVLGVHKWRWNSDCQMSVLSDGSDAQSYKQAGILFKMRCLSVIIWRAMAANSTFACGLPSHRLLKSVLFWNFFPFFWLCGWIRADWFVCLSWNCFHCSRMSAS